ncbi:hypothetical protein [Candidatus Sororendozoicomonas aggregata]|uniref:hypothetical protein n=1 Tax=Candidatus Sororendozoicomonas aggregata TaxID=3073239 RepID=UPI002ED11515
MPGGKCVKPQELTRAKRAKKNKKEQNKNRAKGEEQKDTHKFNRQCQIYGCSFFFFFLFSAEIFVGEIFVGVLFHAAS